MYKMNFRFVSDPIKKNNTHQNQLRPQNDALSSLSFLPMDILPGGWGECPHYLHQKDETMFVKIQISGKFRWTKLSFYI